MVFVPIDFERQGLRETLEAAGLDTRSRVLFSWLGGTAYLGREAFDNVVGFIVSLPAGTGLVFDYNLDPSPLDRSDRDPYDRMLARIAAAGEPFRLCFETPALVRDLTALGFRQVEDFGPQELDARYFAGRADGLRIASSMAHVMRAWTA